jgi:hypothetical protein
MLWQDQLGLTPNSSANLNLGFDFLSVLDHRQIDHCDNEGWSQNYFLYGTEPETTIEGKAKGTFNWSTLSYDYKTSGMLHYNMLFAGENAATNLYNVLDTAGHETYNGKVDYHYKDEFTESEFADLIKDVQGRVGFFVIPHPSQNRGTVNKPYGNTALDYVFEDSQGVAVGKIGFEVIAGSAYMADTKTNYEYWKELLKAGYKYFACAGSDVHGDLDDESNVSYVGGKKYHNVQKAVTSVYTTVKTPDAYMEQFKKGNFTAGSVGIKMCVGDPTTGEVVPMGGECNFAGKKLVVEIGKFYKYEEHTANTLRIWNENEVVYSQDFNKGETISVAFPTDETAKFYRVEVVRTSQDTVIAYGNPIWNTNVVQ